MTDQFQNKALLFMRAALPKERRRKLLASSWEAPILSTDSLVHWFYMFSLIPKYSPRFSLSPPHSRTCSESNRIRRALDSWNIGPLEPVLRSPEIGHSIWRHAILYFMQIEGEKVEAVTDFIFLGFKITADGDCSYKIKRHLLLGRKTMTNLDGGLKSKNITLPTKVHIVKAMVFPVIICRCESWTIKETEHCRTDAFKL